MAKIVAHVAKKLSEVGQFSSRQFSASIEVETEGQDPETLKASLRRLFALAKESVEEQFSAVTARNGNAQNGTATATRQPANGSSNGHPSNGSNGNGNGSSNGNGRFVPATASQKKAIFAICKSVGVDPKSYDCEKMSVGQASRLIDELKSRQSTN